MTERKYIYDGYGNKVYLSDSPQRMEIAAVRLQDTFSSYPGTGLTPARLISILREADGGYMARVMELFEDVEEKDSRIFACLQTRKQAVIGLKWDIVPASQEPAAIAQAELVKSMLVRLPNFSDVQLDLLDAVGKGFAVVEILWGLRGRGLPRKNVIVGLAARRQKQFCWNELQTELCLLTEEEPVNGVPLSGFPCKFLVHNYRGRSGPPARQGLLRTLVWLHLFKFFSIKDWARFLEVYAMPLRLGKYDSSASADDRAALLQAVRYLGTDGAGIISRSTEIEFVSALQGAADGSCYQTFVGFLDKEITILVLGQNLTTEVSEGSRAAAQVHERVRQDLLQGDCVALDRTFSQQMVEPVVIYNFGVQESYPRYQTFCTPPPDLLVEAQIDKILIEDIHLPVGVDYFYDKYHVTKPGAGEALVNSPAPATAQKKVS